MNRMTKIPLFIYFPIISVLFSNCADTPTVPLPPPDAEVVTTTLPDVDGFVTVVGGANAAKADSVVLLFNEETESGVMETADTDGSFEAKIAASTGNVLVLQYKIDVTVSYEAFITVK